MVSTSSSPGLALSSTVDNNHIKSSLIILGTFPILDFVFCFIVVSVLYLFLTINVDTSIPKPMLTLSHTHARTHTHTYSLTHITYTAIIRVRHQGKEDVLQLNVAGRQNYIM